MMVRDEAIGLTGAKAASGRALTPTAATRLLCRQVSLPSPIKGEGVLSSARRRAQLAGRSASRALGAGVGPGEGGVRHGDIVLLAREADGRPLVLRIERDPADQRQAARRGAAAGEDQRDDAIFGALGIAHLDADDIEGACRHDLAIASEVAAGIEQRAERRVANRPALNLLYLIVDHGERAAVADDQQLRVLLIFEADAARLP